MSIDAAPRLDHHAAQRAIERADEIVTAAADFNVTGADLFAAFAAMIAAQNPRLARLTLDALEASVAVHGPAQPPASLAPAIVDACDDLAA
jgi:hypothetical protein